MTSLAAHLHQPDPILAQQLQVAAGGHALLSGVAGSDLRLLEGEVNGTVVRCSVSSKLGSVERLAHLTGLQLCCHRCERRAWCEGTAQPRSSSVRPGGLPAPAYTICQRCHSPLRTVMTGACPPLIVRSAAAGSERQQR